LVAALAKLVEFDSRCVAAIVGSGPLEEPLRDRIDCLGLSRHVRLLGDTVATDVMPAFDCFCLPSRYEGLPYVLLEALAAGLPIVARRVGGVATCVEHGQNGFIVESDSPDDLATVLHRLATDQNRCRELSARSFSKAACLTADRMIDETMAVYERAAVARAGRR
jgi:glycosyltransferase involved in cell wall biosynthesis